MLNILQKLAKEYFLGIILAVIIPVLTVLSALILSFVIDTDDVGNAVGVIGHSFVGSVLIAQLLFCYFTTPFQLKLSVLVLILSFLIWIPQLYLMDDIRYLSNKLGVFDIGIILFYTITWVTGKKILEEILKFLFKPGPRNLISITTLHR